MFVYNKYLIRKYEEIIKSNYHILGSFKNNMIKLNKNKIHDQFLYISGYGKINIKNYLILIRSYWGLLIYISQSRKKFIF